MIVKSIMVLAIELAIFYVLGTSFVTLLMKKKEMPIGVRIIEGFFLYQILFQIMALPFAFLRKRLSMLTWCWDLFIVFLVMISIWYVKSIICRDMLEIRNNLKNIKGYRVAFAVMLLVIVLTCWYASLNGELNEDAEYYIGLVNTTLTSDSMFRYNVYTGELTPSLYLRRALATFEIQAATLCKTFGVAPLVMMRIERACLDVIITSISIYLLGNLCYTKCQKEKCMEKSCMLVSVSFLIYFISDTTIYTNASFLLKRAYEAKAFTGNVIIYFILYLTILMLMTKDKSYGLLLFFVMWGCLALSFSALLVGMAGMGVLVLTYIMVKLYKRITKNKAGETL